MSRIRDNQVICCLTCAVMNPTENGVWSRSWNVSLPDEEMMAFEHAESNPQHIMVRALDFGYAITGQ